MPPSFLTTQKLFFEIYNATLLFLLHVETMIEINLQTCTKCFRQNINKQLTKCKQTADSCLIEAISQHCEKAYFMRGHTSEKDFQAFFLNCCGKQH